MSLERTVNPFWFRIAVQGLVILAGADTACSSGAMARSVNAHAAVVRRVIAPLVRAGIVEAREGRDGGYLLARPAARVTLADVYLALRDESAAPGGDMGRVARVLDAIAAESERATVAVLARHTIATVMETAGVAGE